MPVDSRPPVRLKPFLAHHYHVRCRKRFDHIVAGARVSDYGLRSRQAMQAFPSGSLSPVQVCQAYQFVKVTPVRQVKIGIVSLGGAYSDFDCTTAFAGYNLPVPAVNPITTGGASQDPSDTNSTVENMLDVECSGAAYTFCTGQVARIVECFAPNTGLGIAQAITALVQAGCEVISISWGQAASQWNSSDRAATDLAIQQALSQGVLVFCASGDSSLDDGTPSPTPDYPCASLHAWGVGGTTLSLNPDGAISSEKAWGDGNSQDEGGGGGFDPSVPIPEWQRQAVQASYPGNNFRACPDSSLNGDPASGYQIVSGGAWMVVGGTSASTPMTAGCVAGLLSALPGPIRGGLGPILYPKIKSAFRDVVLGSNGLPAIAGYDVATGCGSINGPGFQAALAGGPVPVPIPTPVPVPGAGPTLQQAQQAAALAISAYAGRYPRYFARIIEGARTPVEAALAALWAGGQSPQIQLPQPIAGLTVQEIIQLIEDLIAAIKGK
jgi:hypothetical protein